jgi:isopentenyl phosphate kinase
MKEKRRGSPKRIVPSFRWEVGIASETLSLSKPLIVIKLGGAALTDKGRICSPRSEIIRSAARQIAAIQSQFSVFIVHGAGSYGHIPVKQFGLSRGFRNASQVRGLSEGKIRLLEWELTLSRAFKQYKIPVVPFIPADYLIARNGRIHSCNTEGIEEWMRLGCVPSTGGDIVPDTSTGFSVVSGDPFKLITAFV